MTIRSYAPFWEGPDKENKEAGIMRDFLEARKNLGLVPFSSVKGFKSDPPDFVARESTGHLIAIELTELVSEEAIKRNVRADNLKDMVYRDWTKDQVVTAIKDLLHKKDKKRYNGGPYDEIQVVIHTDEPVISHRELTPYLNVVKFSGLSQVTRAYLLISYDAVVKSYPLLELHLIKNKVNNAEVKS